MSQAPGRTRLFKPSYFYYSHFIDVHIDLGELTNLLSVVQLLSDRKEALKPEPLTIPSTACPRLWEYKKKAKRSQRQVEDRRPNKPRPHTPLPTVERGAGAVRRSTGSIAAQVTPGRLRQELKLVLATEGSLSGQPAPLVLV